MRNEISKQVKQLIIILGAGICAFFFPIATLFLNITSDKILIGFDIAIYNALIGIVLAILSHWFKKKRLIIKVSVKSATQEASRLILNQEDEGRIIDIIVYISVTGTKRHYKKPLYFICPESYVLQRINKKESSYLQEVENSTKYKIDINKMLLKCPNSDIAIVREIKFSLSLEEYNNGNIDYLKVENEKMFGVVRIESKGLELLQK